MKNNTTLDRKIVVLEDILNAYTRAMLKNKIVIVVDGGRIQHTIGNTDAVEIAVMDYGVEGIEEGRLMSTPQTEQALGAKGKAFCWTQPEPDEVNPSRVEQLFDVINDYHSGH